MNERYSVRSIVHVSSSFLSGSEFTSHQMHVLESPAPAFLLGQASGICLCAEAEGQGRLLGNLGCASSCPEAQAALCVSGHGQQVCIPVPTGLPGLGEWPESQAHTDLLLTPSKVTQTPPRSADSWATMATRGGAGNNASPCALSSPHTGQRIARGMWEGHLAQISVGAGNWIFLPIRTVEHGGGGWSLDLSGVSLSLLYPFCKCTGPHDRKGRKGPHRSQEAWVWLCCGQGSYQGVDSLGV